ncbi:MAG: response regulator transcription factor [Spirochaetaceae bacterium]|jgi:DNA-binding response OmpR family regulator|nr:response regulator transcription factor [Spirochaetaceae bacterium]
MKDQQIILVIDDEEKILEMIRSYLTIYGFKVLCAKDGATAFKIFETNEVDIILLDLMLPDFSGEEICKKIRASEGNGYASSIPIIMLTAKVDEKSIINGLSIGADDYIKKPFSLRELNARITATLRRSAKRQDESACTKLLRGDLVIDTAARTVMRSGKEIVLTPNEYRILSLLASRPEKIFTRDEIIEKALSSDFEGFDRAVDNHIKKLRQKIGDDFKSPDYIITVYGMGYRFANGKGNAS